MHTSASVRNVAKNIVLVYTTHIKSKIKEQDESYIELGIDSSFEKYEELFKVIIGRVLGVPSKTKLFVPNIVLLECIDAVEQVITKKGYTKQINNNIIAQCVYDVCLYILKKVKEEEFGILVN